MDASIFRKRYQDSYNKYGRFRNFAQNFCRILSKLPGVYDRDSVRLTMNDKAPNDSAKITSDDQLQEAQSQVDALWANICEFNTNISNSFGTPYKTGVYDQLGAKYDFDQINPPSCQPPKASTPTSWSSIVANLDDADSFMNARCEDLNKRATNFHELFGDHCLIDVDSQNSKVKLASIILGSICVGIWVLPLLITLCIRVVRMIAGYSILHNINIVRETYENIGGLCILITCICLMGLFLCLLVWAVYKDKKKVGVCSVNTAKHSDNIVIHHRTDMSDQYQIYKNWSGDTIHKMKPSEKDAEWSFSPGNDIDGGFSYDNEPTQGSVMYGINDDLVTVNENKQLVISVSKDVKDGKRRTVRIHANELYDSGVFIMDVAKMPSDQTTWPSFWLRGDTTTSTDKTWACYGEVDIIEGINGGNQNHCTIHTNTTCSQQNVHDGKNNPLARQECDTSSKKGQTCGCDKQSWCPDLGCSYLMAANSFGPEFNNKNGGVFACELSVKGQVTIWFWPRDDPLYPQSQIESGKIQTGSWQTTDPANTIYFDACPGSFANMAVLINTTLCGEWAGNQYVDSIDKSIIGWDACKRAVADSRFTYDNGNWIINSVKIFQ